MKPWIGNHYAFWPERRYAVPADDVLTMIAHSLRLDLLEQVWAIRVTLHYLSDDGNLLDCACMAAMAALRHFKKEEVEVRGDEITVVSMSFAVSHDQLGVTLMSYVGIFSVNGIL